MSKMPTFSVKEIHNNLYCFLFLYIQDGNKDLDEIPGGSVQSNSLGGTPKVTISHLHFSSVQPDYAGLYVCAGKNAPGIAESLVSLQVTCENHLNFTFDHKSILRNFQ